jgi:hypothetical protein
VAQHARCSTATPQSHGAQQRPRGARRYRPTAPPPPLPHTHLDRDPALGALLRRAPGAHVAGDRRPVLHRVSPAGPRPLAEEPHPLAQAQLLLLRPLRLNRPARPPHTPGGRAPHSPPLPPSPPGPPARCGAPRRLSLRRRRGRGRRRAPQLAHDGIEVRQAMLDLQLQLRPLLRGAAARRRPQVWRRPARRLGAGRGGAAGAERRRGRPVTLRPVARRGAIPRSASTGTPASTPVGGGQRAQMVRGEAGARLRCAAGSTHPSTA